MMSNDKYLPDSLRLIASSLMSAPLESLILNQAADRLEELESVLKDYVNEDRMATPDDLMKTQGVKAGEINVFASGTGRSLVAEEIEARYEERRKALDACNCLDCFQREMKKDRELGIIWNRIISDDKSEV